MFADSRPLALHCARHGDPFMHDALKRLRALQQELESLHRTTERVLAESEQLIDELEGARAPIVPAPPRARGARPRASGKPASRRAAPRPR
jgi:hypothetical protein